MLQPAFPLKGCITERILLIEDYAIKAAMQGVQPLDWRLGLRPKDYAIKAGMQGVQPLDWRLGLRPSLLSSSPPQAAFPMKSDRLFASNSLERVNIL